MYARTVTHLKTRLKVSPVERASPVELEEQLLVQTTPLEMRDARCKRCFAAEVGWVSQDNPRLRSVSLSRGTSQDSRVRSIVGSQSPVRARASFIPTPLQAFADCVDLL